MRWNSKVLYSIRLILTPVGVRHGVSDQKATRWVVTVFLLRSSTTTCHQTKSERPKRVSKCRIFDFWVESYAIYVVEFSSTDMKTSFSLYVQTHVLFMRHNQTPERNLCTMKGSTRVDPQAAPLYICRVSTPVIHVPYIQTNITHKGTLFTRTA